MAFAWRDSHNFLMRTRSPWRSLRIALVLMLAPALALGQSTSPPAATPPPSTAPQRSASAACSKEQLEQLVAPIALYPDALLSQ